MQKCVFPKVSHLPQCIWVRGTLISGVVPGFYIWVLGVLEWCYTGPHKMIFVIIKCYEIMYWIGIYKVFDISSYDVINID